MQFTSNIIVALLLVVSGSTVTAAQEFSNIRGGLELQEGKELSGSTPNDDDSCEEEDNACLRATVADLEEDNASLRAEVTRYFFNATHQVKAIADLEDRLRLCLPVDCVDGFERDTDLSCDKACAGECCAGGTNNSVCRGFTGHVHRDGSCTGKAACTHATIDEVKGSCKGLQACMYATIDEVTGSCTGKAACRRGTFDLATESCNQDFICRSSIVSLIERSCNSYDDKDCRLIIAPFIVDNNKTPNPPPEVNCLNECGHLKDRKEINECMNKCMRA